MILTITITGCYFSLYNSQKGVFQKTEHNVLQEKQTFAWERNRLRPLGLILAPEVSNRECFGVFFNLKHKQELPIRFPSK